MVGGGEVNSRGKNKERSEEQRQQGLYNIREEFEKRKKQLQQGLFGVSDPAKKIKFSLSDSEEEERKSVKKAKKKERKEKKRSLFDNTENGYETEENEFEKAILRRKDQSEDLKEMEASFDGDDRFQLDRRFEDEKTSTKLAGKDIKTEQLDAEKERGYSILENVLGKSVSRPSQKEDEMEEEGKKKSKKYLGKMTRFDPENSSHYQFENVKSSEEIGQEASQKEEPLPDDEKPEEKKAVERKSFMSNNFADYLRSKNEEEAPENGFSLTAALGLPSTSVPKVIDKPSELDTPSPQVSKKVDRNRKTVQRKGEPFFFCAKDQRLTKEARRFCRTEDMAKVKSRWEKSRLKLISSFKRQRKQAVRAEQEQKKRQWRNQQ